MRYNKQFVDHWSLNRDIDFLNHGSFGATPKCVQESQRRWIAAMEKDPIEFLAPERTLLTKLEQTRAAIGTLVGAAPNCLGFVRNATEGVNAVLRSFPFRRGDQVVITNHGYNACNNVARHAAEQSGARVVVADMPFPIRDPGEVVEAIERSLTAKTRLLLIDHVTSPTGLIFPIAAIIELAKRKDIRVMIDGAHAPGMIPVDLDDLQPDYYTANHHKWLCGPKTSGFLYVRRELQSEVRPTVISHGANSPGYGDTSFLAEFNWMGTFDPTPILSMTRALEFLRSLFPSGLSQLMRENQKLAVAGRRCLLEALELESPAPESMLGSLASIPIPVERLAATQPANTTNPLHAFQQQLFGEFRIEVPVFPLNPTTACLRISAQAYNSIEQYRHLAEVLNKLIIR